MAVKQLGPTASGASDGTTKGYVDAAVAAAAVTIVDNGDGTYSAVYGSSPGGSGLLARTQSLPGRWVGAYSGVGNSAGNLGGGATTPGSTNIQGHQIAVDCTNLRVVLPYGFYSTSGSTAADVPTTASIPSKVSIQVGSAVYPVTFNGQQSVTCDPGGRLVSDPIGGFWAAGTQVYLRILDAQAAPGLYITTMPASGPSVSSFGNNGYTLSADLTGSTTGPANTNPSDNLWGAGIIGTPLAPTPFSVGALGDSITAGTGDTGTGYSWVTRATNATVPCYRVSIAGARAAGYAGVGFYSIPLLAGATHCFVLLGTNDMGADGASYATLTGNLTKLYKALRAEGVVPVGVTIPPHTDSSDGWATTANQSISATGYAGGASSIRSQVNAWIRAGGGGILGGYFEFADQVETARDSGIWKANYTADGLHPTSTGHAAVAAAVNLTTIAAMS